MSSLFTEDLCYEGDCEITIIGGNIDSKTGKKRVKYHIGFYGILPEMAGHVYACIGPKDIAERQPTGLTVRKDKSIWIVPQFVGLCYCVHWALSL